MAKARAKKASKIKTKMNKLKLKLQQVKSWIMRCSKLLLALKLKTV